MTRRTLLQQLIAVAASILILFVSSGAFAQGRSDEALERVIDVQDRRTAALMAIDGVEGTGVGYNENGELAIKIYTANVGVPGIPQDLEGIPVQPVVTGRFVARASTTDRWPRPVPIGVSTGHPDITAGTIGCRVRDTSGNVYALSNNHVYANTNEAEYYDNVLQPGPYDGGKDPEDAIGVLVDYEPILFDGSNNSIDAAIALSSEAELGTGTPTDDGYGTPSKGIASASIGLKVQKYGRTTGRTRGEVSEINVTVQVCYETAGPFMCKKSAIFVDQIAISPGRFSDGGDSGSLIVTDDGNNKAVGLLFAGSSTRTIANQIGEVLDRFQVSIDDGSSDSGTINSSPTADFTYTVKDLTADFTDQSSDSDGSIVGWAWDFGDEATSTEQNPSHTYGSGGTYTVTLTATDDDGATDTTSQDVTVASATAGGITLTANGYKVKGRHTVDLKWSGATSTNVDVYRNGDLHATTANDGEYTDATNYVGGGSYTYYICEAGTTTCSNEATVTF